MAAEADIDAILSVQFDPAKYGETRRCLADREYRSFRPLGDRHILFDGSRGRLWINILQHRCSDLRYGDVVVVRPFGGMRMCQMDQFQVADWFDWPWYRRWPWHWGPSWGTGIRRALGEFQPVTAEQVAEIEAVLQRD